MLTLVKTLDELIDDTLSELARYDERGYRVQLDAVGLPTVGATTLSLVSSARVTVADVIEFGSELTLVTDVSVDAVPVITVARGYDGTTAAVHTPSSLGLVNPQFARDRVSRTIQTALTRLDAARVFCVVSGTFTRTASKQYIEMPASCRQVLTVGFFDSVTGRFEDDINGWRYFDDMPTSVITSGKIVRLPSYISDGDSLVITYRTPYRWNSYPADPTGASTITLPEGAEDLPALYAVARLCSHREMSRIDLDRSEEWNRSTGVVNGITQGTVRQLWTEFYKSLAEAQTLNQLPIPRPFITKRRFL